MRKEFEVNMSRDIGTISFANGYTLELNYCGYWDLRRWYRPDNRPLGGVAMTDKEIKELYALLTDEVMPLLSDR